MEKTPMRFFSFLNAMRLRIVCFYLIRYAHKEPAKCMQWIEMETSVFANGVSIRALTPSDDFTKLFKLNRPSFDSKCCVFLSWCDRCPRRFAFIHCSYKQFKRWRNKKCHQKKIHVNPMAKRFASHFIHVKLANRRKNARHSVCIF